MNVFKGSLAPKIRPLELAASFVSRLAAWLRFDNAKQFCADFDIDFDDVSAGQPEQLRKVADMTDTPIEDLGHGPVRHGGRFLVDGQLLSTAYLDRVDLWICPECVREDLAAAPHLAPEAAIAVRRDDVVFAIGGCARHRRRLVRAGRSEWRYGRHDTSLTTMDIAPALTQLEALSTLMEPSSIDTFMRECFQGIRHRYRLLKGMELYQVLKLAGHFGNWTLTGGQSNLRRLPRDEMNRVYSAGLDLLAGGEDAIAGELDRMLTETAFARNPPTRRLMSNIRTMIFDNRMNPAFGPIDAAVRSAAARHSYRHQRELSAGGATNWAPLEQTSRALRIGRETARAFATEAGARHETKAGWVNPTLLTEWIGKDGGLVPVWQAARDIGASDHQMACLLEHGHLATVTRKEAKKGAFNWLRRNDVDALMDRFLAPALPVVIAPAGTASISSMVRRARGSLPAIHRALADNRLQVHRLVDAKPYASILFDIEKVFGLLGIDTDGSATEGDDLISIQEFAQRCGLKAGVVYGLVGLGVLRTETRVNAKTGLSRKGVFLPEVERFNRDFITLVKVARMLRWQLRHVVPRLSLEGIKPLDTAKVPITIFRRSDLAGYLKD